MLLIFENLGALYLLVGLALLVDLVVLILHLLRPVGHLDHHPFQPLQLHPPDAQHRLPVVPLLSSLTQASFMQHLVADVSHILLCLLAALKGFGWALVWLFLEDLDEGGEFRPCSVVAAMVLFGESGPCTFLGQFIDGGFLIFKACFQCGSVLFFFDYDANSLLLGSLLAIGLI
jgi:hypothetical protein